MSGKYNEVCSICLFNFQTPNLVASFEVTRGFPVYSQNQVYLRGCHSSRGRPPLRAGPVHFSCSIPGRKGFHFTMVKSSFKRHSLSRAEPPALTRSPGSRVLCSGTGLFTGTRHTWQCHCSLYHSLVSQRSSFRSRAKSSLRTYIGTNYLPLSNTNILGGRHFKYEENPNLGYLEMG